MAGKRIALLIVAIIVAIICVGFAGMYTLTRAIYREKGCEFANIDNIEIHTKTDIPETISCNCNFNESSYTKIAVFELDPSIDFPDYISENKFRKLSPQNSVNLNEEKFALVAEDYIGKTHLYFRADESDANIYKMILDTDLKKLHVIIQYKK